jgi:hypothetical protein
MYEAKRKNTELLLAYKADINAQNVNGETPLMRSIIHSPNSITQLLLAAKADTEIEDEESNTVLKIALDSSQKSQLLIEWGAQLIPIDKMVHSQTIAQEKIYSSIFAKHEQEPSAEVIQYKTNLTQTLNPFIPVTVLAQLVVQYVPNLEIHIMLNQTRPQNPAPLPPISSKKYTIQHLMRQLCSHDKKTNAK